MRKICITAVIAISLLTGSLLLKADDIDIKTKRLSDRVAVFTFGPYDSNITAIASEKGIVVIDTFTREITLRIRKAIETEFKRTDFACLINSHGHFDHFIGNQIYKDIKIIGHKNILGEMQDFAKGIPVFITSRQDRNKRIEDELKTFPKNSPEALQRQDIIKINSQMIDDLKDGFVCTPPTDTISDALNLDMGDLHIECYYYENAHSTSDILIYVPDEELLFTGDIFSNSYLPISVPIGQIDRKLPIQHWIDLLNGILNERKVKYVVSSGGSLLTKDDMLLRLDYITRLWDDLREAGEANRSFDETARMLNLHTRFNSLTKTPFTTAQLSNLHINLMKAFWRQLTKTAAWEVEKELGTSGIEAALKKYAEMKSISGNDYFFDENDFNALGYNLLQKNKIDEAIAVFQLNTEAYPNSSNAYDSLAEAYNAKGNKEFAIKNYIKSVEKNPSNTNAVNYLDKEKPDWKNEFKPLFRKFADNIYRITCPLGLKTNIITIIGSSETLLVDTGQRGNEQAISDTLSELGSKEVKFIINTHKHGDHFGNNKSIGGNATIIDGNNYEEFLQKGILKRCKEKFAGKSDKKFDDCLSMTFNDIEIILIPNQGIHSSSDIMIYFPQYGIAHLGDLLLTQSFPAVGNKVKEYMAFLETAVEIFPEKTIFIGGHGRDFTMQDLKSLKVMLSETIEIIHKEMKSGKIVDQMRKAGILDKFSDYNSFLHWLNTDYWIEAVYNSY